MRRWLPLMGLLLAAGACADEPATPEPLFGAPPRAEAPPPPEATQSARPPKDACGAVELQHLIGRSRMEIPVPLEPSRQRVACTTCPVTQDFRPDRLNFFFDAQTGVIKEIRCG